MFAVGGSSPLPNPSSSGPATDTVYNTQSKNGWVYAMSVSKDL